jgi:hypothetical protein
LKGQKTGGRDFLPGNDPRRNAGGFPKVPAGETAEFCAWCREHREELQQLLLDMLRGEVKGPNAWVRERALRLMIEYGFGRPPQVGEPGDDALDISDDVPRVAFSDVPTPQSADEWAAKHSKPAEPPNPEMIAQMGGAPPPAKVPVEGNGHLAPWKPAMRWPPTGER